MAPRTRTVSGRPGILLAALLVLSVSLAGCSTLEKAQSAAIVNGTSISDAVPAQVSAEWNAKVVPLLSLPQMGTAEVLQWLVLAPFVLNQAKASGSWVPDALYNAVLAKVPDASQGTKDLLATTLALRGGTLSQQDIQTIIEELKKADIQLDPRYGTFDPNNGLVVAPDNNWLRPAATATVAAPGSSAPPTSSPSDVPTGP